MRICTELDDFVQQRIYWRAILDDETIVYQDDSRFPDEDQSAWFRLKSYCDHNQRYIKEIGLFVNRNEPDCVYMAPKSTSYFYIKKAEKWDWSSPITQESVLLGHQDGEHVNIRQLLLDGRFVKDEKRLYNKCKKTMIQGCHQNTQTEK